MQTSACKLALQCSASAAETRLSSNDTAKLLLYFSASRLTAKYCKVLQSSCKPPTRYESVGCDDENFSSPKEFKLAYSLPRRSRTSVAQPLKFVQAADAETKFAGRTSVAKPLKFFAINHSPAVQ